MEAKDAVVVGEPAKGPTLSTEQAIVLRGETSAMAQAEQAKAAIQARYVMALRRPRDWDEVRSRLLKECSRPGFAEVARYHKPIGKGVEGPSIRFAEAAIRCMTNVLAESAIVYEDDEKRQIRVSVTDLEANVTYPIDVMVAKTVERSKLPQGETALRVRMNSKNLPVYLLPATEDDLLNKQNAQVSKALRTSGLRLLPGDILEECMSRVLSTKADEDAKDPDAAKKRIIDGFAALGIGVSDLKTYVGHELSVLAPAELAELRGLYTALKDGEATWVAALESKGRTSEKKPPKDEDGKTTIDRLADKIGDTETAPAAQTTPTPTTAPQPEPAKKAGQGRLV